MIEVSINQQNYSFPDSGTLADVLPLLQILQADGIAIALNEAVSVFKLHDDMFMRKK